MISKIDKYGLLIKLQDQVTIKYSIRYQKPKYLQIIKIKILWDSVYNCDLKTLMKEMEKGKLRKSQYENWIKLRNSTNQDSMKDLKCECAKFFFFCLKLTKFVKWMTSRHPLPYLQVSI